MPLEHTYKLWRNFIESNETQNNKQINYDPDYSLNTASPLAFLQIHWHQDMLQCRDRNRHNLWWWNQILLRSCQSRCNPFLLFVHVYALLPEIQLTSAQKEHASSHHFGHLGITRLLGSFLLTLWKEITLSGLCPTLLTELLAKDTYFAALLIFYIYPFQLHFPSFYHLYCISSSL